MTWCVGGKHYSNTDNISHYEKINPKTEKLVCGRNKSPTFTK